MRKILLLLVCLSLFAAQANAQFGKEMIEGAAKTAARETGAHAAADAVLTSHTARAMMPIMQLSPVFAYDAYATSMLGAINAAQQLQSPVIAAKPVTAKAPATGTTPSASIAKEWIPLYAPGGFVGISDISAMAARVSPTIRNEVQRALSLQEKINLHRLQKQERKRQLQAQQLHRAKQDLPQLLTEQTYTVSAAGLLDKLPSVRLAEPPAMSFMFDKSKLAEAIEVSNPNIPLLPFMQEPGFVYRGMAVKPSDITRFFQPGVGIERRLTEASNRLNMSMAAGSHGATMYFATHKVINMTPIPQYAQFWGSKFLTPQKPILIIVRIKGNFSGGPIINYDKDVLPEDIDSMVALLEQDGYPCWFDIRPAENGMFQITPYEMMRK